MFLFRVREPELRTDRVSTSLREYIARLPTILRGDVDLSRFLVARLVASLGTMGVGFYAVYALNDLKLAEWQMGAFNFILLATQMVSSVVFGNASGPLWPQDSHHGRHWKPGDRKPCRSPIVRGLVVDISCLCRCWRDLRDYGSVRVQHFVGIRPSGQQPTYTALAGLLLSPTTFAAPIIGGLLADAAGYQAMFWLSTAISLIAVFLFIFYVRDPRDLRAEPPFCPRR